MPRMRPYLPAVPIFRVLNENEYTDDNSRVASEKHLASQHATS